MYDLNRHYRERAEAGVILDKTRSIQDPHFPPVDSGAFGF
jgi:hypothetical protein